MDTKVIEADVLVIGGGLAGTFAAIKAKESGANKVTLVSKGKLGKDSVSTFAAGVYMMNFPEDDKDALIRTYTYSDSFGAGLYDPEWLNVHLDESYERLLEMEGWGVEWEKTPNGKFERMVQKHGQLKCMFHGTQLMEAMAQKVKTSDVNVLGHIMITDLLTENGEPGGRVTGAIGFDCRTGEFKVLKSKATVLAAGACTYKSRFAGHKFQTGESYAMAYRAGAVLGRFEIGEIHHETSTEYDIQGLNMFQGLGGKFVNANAEEFLHEYDPVLGNKTSMPRIAEAAAMEVRAGRGPMYLDMTHFTPEQVRKLKVVLPIPVRIMERAGIIIGDRIVRKMEWAPAFLATNAMGGGVFTNTRCETNLPGLYVCGDAMARSIALPSRLPGAAVTGARAGRFAAEYSREAKEPGIDERQVEMLKKSTSAPLEIKDGIEPDHVIIALQEAVIPYDVVVISRDDRLEKAINELERIRDEEVPLLYASDAHYLRLANEARNMVL
ncbi:MAG: FAD-binding protein, partial [Dehalococcoidia bacterium]|nr:FAD-binding protein [Dehalococcoidia bacterium]